VRPRAAGALAGAILLATYTLTLAPSVTFWDAGELLAAVESFGIPHPPGTPLWVLVARAWSEVLGMMPRALAVNLMSAFGVSAACAVLAALIAAWTNRSLPGLAAGVCAGLMSTVWLNATETEVYALSLLLSAVMLYAGHRAGTTGEWRWLVLTAYALALAVPLHLSALVAAPAAIVLASTGAEDRWMWRRAALLTSLLIAVIAVGTASATLLVPSVVLLVVSVTASKAPRQAIGLPLVAVLALSALLFLPIRAAFDPWLNTQHPVEWGPFWELIGRRQYGEQPVWPRRSPAWAQLGMLAQYADWQIALGVAPGIAAHPLRIVMSVLFAALGVTGARWHYRMDRRSWLAMLVLLVSGTLGVAAYLNFRAGPTFGHGILPSWVEHEARERDYFFLLGFWAWGAWAGMGAMYLARRLGRPGAAAGIAAAMLPLLLNWRAADRSREPEASLPRSVAVRILESAPQQAILVTGGDNDSYPAWYAQTVEGVRPDVLVIVAPMLNAMWYREEIARRYALLDPVLAATAGVGEVAALRDIARHAVAQGRALLIASTVDGERRSAVASGWMLTGLAFERGDQATEIELPGLVIRADTAMLRRHVERFPPPDAHAVRESTDPTARVMGLWLGCPAQILAIGRGEAPGHSLATVCKL
jgi:hypothetical protein